MYIHTTYIMNYIHTHSSVRAHIHVHTLLINALSSRSHDLRNVGLSTSVMLPNVFIPSQAELPEESLS